MVATRFDYHLSPFGQRGGISLYPVCGVVSGVKLALTGSGYNNGSGEDKKKIKVTVSAGELKLDGVRIVLGSNKAVEIDYTDYLEVGQDLSNTQITVPIWINPKRKVVASITAPSNPSNGDMYFEVYNVEDYQIINTIKKYQNSQWVTADPMSDIPISQSQNMLPLNDILTTDIVVSITPEVPVFHKTNIPPHVYSPSNAMARQTASIYLGEVSFDGEGAASITKTMPDYYLLTV